MKIIPIPHSKFRLSEKQKRRTTFFCAHLISYVLIWNSLGIIAGYTNLVTDVMGLFTKNNIYKPVMYFILTYQILVLLLLQVEKLRKTGLHLTVASFGIFIPMAIYDSSNSITQVWFYIGLITIAIYAIRLLTIKNKAI